MLHLDSGEQVYLDKLRHDQQRGLGSHMSPAMVNIILRLIDRSIAAANATKVEDGK